MKKLIYLFFIILVIPAYTQISWEKTNFPGSELKKGLVFSNEKFVIASFNQKEPNYSSDKGLNWQIVKKGPIENRPYDFVIFLTFYFTNNNIIYGLLPSMELPILGYTTNFGENWHRTSVQTWYDYLLNTLETSRNEIFIPSEIPSCLIYSKNQTEFKIIPPDSINYQFYFGLNQPDIDINDNLYYITNSFLDSTNQGIYIKKISSISRKIIFEKKPKLGNFNFLLCLDGDKIYIFNDSTVYLSNDDCDTWNKLAYPYKFHINEVARDKMGNIWLATDSGVVASFNKGISWERHNDGFTGNKVTSIACAPDGYIYIAVDYDDLYRIKEPINSVIDYSLNKEILTISGDKSIIIPFDNININYSNIKLYNISALKLDIPYIFSGNSAEMDISGLDKGVYFIIIDGNRTIYKLLKY